MSRETTNFFIFMHFYSNCYHSTVFQYKLSVNLKYAEKTVKKLARLQKVVLFNKLSLVFHLIFYSSCWYFYVQIFYSKNLSISKHKINICISSRAIIVWYTLKHLSRLFPKDKNFQQVTWLAHDNDSYIAV